MGKEKKSNLNGVVVNQRLRKACHVKGIPLVRTEALLRLRAQAAALLPSPSSHVGSADPSEIIQQKKTR